MVDTNDVFNDAVRGSTLHNDENGEVEKSFMGSKILATLLLSGIAYIGFNYYSTTVNSEALVVKKEVIAKVQTKTDVIASVTTETNHSEEEYLKALKSIESELREEREPLNLNPEKQMNLSVAMNDLIEEATSLDNTSYAKALNKEIASETKTTTVVADNNIKEKARKIIVKKGDTLRGLSSEFYGDPMNYKRIIASNDSLHLDDTIYEGQTIILPY